MNVAQAAKALKDHSDQIQDPIPEMFLTSSIPAVVTWMLGAHLEDRQARSNQEWEELLKAENDPVEAAKLLLGWFADQAQAEEKMAGEAEEASAPPEQRMSL